MALSEPAEAPEERRPPSLPKAGIMPSRSATAIAISTAI